MTDTAEFTATASPPNVAPVRRLPLSHIRIDGGTQLRAACSDATVSEYAEALKSGAVLPPVVVFQDGNDIWLADGFHRHAAHVAAGLADIAADIRHGDRRAALLFAAGANAEHGLRRTQEDKRQAVLTLLRDPEWRGWSDRAIADRVKVSHPMVARIRRDLNGTFTIEEPGSRTFLSRHGTEASRRVTRQTQTGSVVESFLRKLPDDALLSEVQRRGLSLAGSTHA